MANTSKPAHEWAVMPQKSGDILLGYAGGETRFQALLSAEQIGVFIAALLLGARDAHASSGRPAQSTQAAKLPPLAPATVRLLNPQRNKWALAVRVGAGEIVFDISGLDLAELGRALIAASAPTKNEN